MGFTAYLTLTGQKQGAINGSVTEKGKENSILVHAFDVQITSPRDPSTGLPTGKRMHQPITIVKEIDKSSPLLWNALVTNENITTWSLQVWAPTTTPTLSGAMQKKIYTVELTNASIASKREFMPDNALPANATVPTREEVTFTYQKIQWTWIEGGVTSSDDWEAPVS